jgi:hypothetical protein
MATLTGSYALADDDNEPTLKLSSFRHPAMAPYPLQGPSSLLDSYHSADVQGAPRIDSHYMHDPYDIHLRQSSAQKGERCPAFVLFCLVLALLGSLLECSGLGSIYSGDLVGKMTPRRPQAQRCQLPCSTASLAALPVHIIPSGLGAHGSAISSVKHYFFLPPLPVSLMP